MIDVGRDTAMLRRAAVEFFNEGYEYSGVSSILRDTPPELQQEARLKLLPQRTVPDGWFVWVGYLIWLERVLELAEIPLFAVEAEGLLILKSERNRFQNAHPACPHCGMPNEVHALRCRDCMGEIGR